MKNVKDYKEIDRVKELIDINRFSLNNCLLDAAKLTGNKVNELDIDEIEDITTNKITAINIWEAKKDRMNYKFTQYLLNMDIYIDGDLYRVENWFTYDRVENMIEDAEIFADNNYSFN